MGTSLPSVHSRGPIPFANRSREFGTFQLPSSLPGIHDSRSQLFERQIIGLGEAHGGKPFWLEVLSGDLNPENLWRGIQFLTCIGYLEVVEMARQMLGHKDSRVRGWACYALGRFGGAEDEPRLLSLRQDRSIRVRLQARSALAQGRRWPVPMHSARRNYRHQPGPIILVSDDHEGWRDHWKSELESQGFRVTQAACEDQTLEAALRLRPTVVITDNQKGRDNMSGLRMTEKASRMPELDDTLLFMFSADDIDGPFYWNGGDRCIPKDPATLRYVSRTLWEYLDD